MEQTTLSPDLFGIELVQQVAVLTLQIQDEYRVLKYLTCLIPCFQGETD